MYIVFNKIGDEYHTLLIGAKNIIWNSEFKLWCSLILNVPESCYILDCPQSVRTSLSSITDRALCTVSSSCTNIKCCVNVPLLNRTFEVGMELDYSYMSLRVYVEKMTRRQSLIGYQFGQEETLSVHGVFKLRSDIV